MTAGPPEFEPIASYGMHSDCSSAALVGHSGSIDWLITAAWEIDRARVNAAAG